MYLPRTAGPRSPPVILQKRLRRVATLIHWLSGEPVAGTDTDESRRGIYLLPNMFTTAGLFAGFYAIVAAMGGRFEAAASRSSWP